MTTNTKRQKTAFLSLHLCLGMVLLASSLAQAARLEIPDNGARLSGIGVISGWKCEAEGDITVRIDGGNPLVMVYGSERGDTQETPDGKILCGDKDNGFLAIFNYALLGDGKHTAVAYDNGVEFDRNTFEVATLGEEFVEGAQAQLRVPNFPSPGEEAWFEWNKSTQHLELRESAQMGIDQICEWLEAPSVPGYALPLLPPPPLPCPRGDSFDGEYYIRFVFPPPPTDPSTGAPVLCRAARGTMQVEIKGGRISGSIPTPPHGRLRVSGEVCDKNGLFVGQWTLDGQYEGYFTGSLADPNGHNCQSRWLDTANCTGAFNVLELPRQ